MLFPERMSVEREDSSFRRGGSSTKRLKARTRVVSLLRSTSPRGREVSWLEWRSRVVRLCVGECVCGCGCV